MQISYQEYLQKDSFTKEELLAHAWGSLVSDPPEAGLSMLPAPPMLMFDRITEVAHNGNKGRIVAEQDIQLDAWFFQCHFRADPVQPGCLGVDAVWQLLGFYTTLRGAAGTGRALAAKDIEFLGQIRPHNKLVTYELNVRRYVDLVDQGSALSIADANVYVDSELIYIIKAAKAGVFKNIQYKNYPHKGDNHYGGVMQRDAKES